MHFPSHFHLDSPAPAAIATAIVTVAATFSAFHAIRAATQVGVWPSASDIVEGQRRQPGELTFNSSRQAADAAFVAAALDTIAPAARVQVSATRREREILILLFTRVCI
jgi:hypothetical protein